MHSFSSFPYLKYKYICTGNIGYEHILVKLCAFVMLVVTVQILLAGQIIIIGKITIDQAH